MSWHREDYAALAAKATAAIQAHPALLGCVLSFLAGLAVGIFL